ncbi:MAG: histidine phosphatase family protein [Desulfovibrio sp.]|nr:histidine phosphatase family protein [Desulfovibrio sp.]
MRKLYVAMVGLPARGKSTLARRIRQGLQAEGTRAEIFNNGDVRRALLGAESTEPDFYNPDNSFGREAREMICRQNLEQARQWLAQGGEVAILDATNASRARRAFIERTLTDHPVLFVECVNEDPLLLNACIRRKADLPEYASFSTDAALESFMKRISYYETIYDPVQEEKFWLCVDSTANRVLAERPCEGSPFYPAIREIVVSMWVHSLFLARHGQTEFNVQGRIGGDPPLTAKGRAQAQALARHMHGHQLGWVFTSTRFRSHETAAPLLADRPGTHVMALKEFDEIWAGECENMLYSEIREKMPEVTAGRNADKYGYAYPGGESYAILRERVQRGLRRALFLAGDSPVLIVGHQAINRVLLSLFLRQRTEDVPYIHIPQNQYYHIELTPQRKVFERIPYEPVVGKGE